MSRVNPIGMRQIGNRPGDAQASMHCADGQAESGHGVLEQTRSGVIESTMLHNFLGNEVRVAEGRGPGAPRGGSLAGREDAGADGLGP
ncbi:MAG TPA: hypothetical protein VGG65_03895, partial [Thermoanaerobaculia bacterium]